MVLTVFFYFSGMQYSWIAGVAIATGSIFVLFFLVVVKEPRLDHHVQDSKEFANKVGVDMWFSKLLYYQVATVYVLTRLTINVSQVIMLFHMFNRSFFFCFGSEVYNCVCYAHTDVSFSPSLWLVENPQETNSITLWDWSWAGTHTILPHRWSSNGRIIKGSGKQSIDSLLSPHPNSATSFTKRCCLQGKLVHIWVAFLCTRSQQ